MKKMICDHCRLPTIKVHAIGRYGGSNDGRVASLHGDGKNYRIVRNHHGSQTLRFCREEKAAIFDAVAVCFSNLVETAPIHGT